MSAVVHLEVHLTLNEGVLNDYLKDSKPVGESQKKAEPKTRIFVNHIDPKNPNVIISHQIFDDEEAVLQHITNMQTDGTLGLFKYFAKPPSVIIRSQVDLSAHVVEGLQKFHPEYQKVLWGFYNL